MRLHEQLLTPQRSNLDRAWKVEDAIRTLERTGRSTTNRALATEVGSSARTIRRLKRIGAQITPEVMEQGIGLEEFSEDDVHELPLATLERIARRAKQDPAADVVAKLRSVLREADQDRTDPDTASLARRPIPTFVRRVVGWVLSVLMPVLSAVRSWMGHTLDPP